MPIARAETEIFRDSFDNGIASDSNGITGFWTPSIPAAATLTEGDGKLVIKAGGSTSSNGTIGAYLYGGAPSAAWNFFSRPVRYSAKVLIGGTSPAAQNVFRFSLTGLTGNSYTVEDALALVIRADNYFVLGCKQDRTYATAEGTKNLASGTLGGTIQRFDLTLDRTGYNLTVFHDGPGGSSTYSGLHGLVFAQWGVDGNSSITLEAVRSTGSAGGAGTETSVILDEVTVTDLGTPAILLDSFSNGNPVASDWEAGLWTATAPLTSSVSETSGRLVQIATAPNTNTIIVNSRTPVESRFNFFDRQIRIGASLLMGGSASAGYMRQGRLLLSSSAADGLVSPDTLSVGFRGYNDVTFSAKIDAPIVHPDNASNPAVRFLIGQQADPFVTFTGDDVVNRMELTLDADRFRLVTFNGGGGSGMARFSGKHGVSRGQWGAAGDSSVMLETVRTGSASADSTASGSWDDLTVTEDDEPILDEPVWDYSISTSAKCRLWLPSTAPVIRGVIFIGPGSGGDYRYMVHDPVAQEAARSLGFGLIGYKGVGLWDQNSSRLQGVVRSLLEQAALASGHPEIANAPFCFTGNSAGAFDATYVAQAWPERLIAFVAHRGGTNTFGTVSEKTKRVPGLFMAGSVDYNGLTNPYALKNVFLNWRAAGCQVAYAVNWGVGHTMRGNQSWESTWTWMVEVANLRYPSPVAPSLDPGAEAPILLDIPSESGWLGDCASFSAATTPSATSPFTPIERYASYTGNLTAASWMPNETCARMYRALTSTDLASRTSVPLHGPIRIASPAQFQDPVPLGHPVTIEVDPREFDDALAPAAFAFYNGDVLLGTDSTGPEWSWTFTPVSSGLHTITVVGSSVDGTRRDALRTLLVSPSNYPPHGVNSVQESPPNTPISGSLSGIDPEGKAIAFFIGRKPEHGVLIYDQETAAYLYQPAHGFSGTDTFTFTPEDGSGPGTPGTVTLTVQPPVDHDADGLSDEWETAHACWEPFTDSDGDGFTNIEEFIAATHPKDPSDFLGVQSLSVDPDGKVVLNWASKASVRYRVQVSSDLKAFEDIPRTPEEEIQTGLSGTDAVGMFVDDYSPALNGQSGRKFWRIKVIK